MDIVDKQLPVCVDTFLWGKEEADPRKIEMLPHQHLLNLREEQKNKMRLLGCSTVHEITVWRRVP